MGLKTWHEKISDFEFQTYVFGHMVLWGAQQPCSGQWGVRGSITVSLVQSGTKSMETNNFIKQLPCPASLLHK